ncbi:MAG: hypothetical protein ACKPCP_36435 [Sphaerospermopsis kisseleviana]
MNIKSFSSVAEKQQFLDSLPFRVNKDNPATRYKYLKEWMANSDECHAFKEERGLTKLNVKVGRGKIEAIENGCWGYGGDRWAVVIDGERYPSSYVILSAIF